jgi:hypothetical protein
MYSWAGPSARPSDCRSAPGPLSRPRAAVRSTYSPARSACRSEYFISTNVIFLPCLARSSSAASTQPRAAPICPCARLPHPFPNTSVHHPNPTQKPSWQAGRSLWPARQSTAASALSTGLPGWLACQWLAPSPLPDPRHASKVHPPISTHASAPSGRRHASSSSI